MYSEEFDEIDPLLICPITNDVFAYPVQAEDGNTYEKAAILRWLESKHTSPLDPSHMISEQGLVLNRTMLHLITRLFEKGRVEKSVLEAWNARRNEPKKLHDEGKFLEAAKLGHPAAMGVMARRYYLGTDGVVVDHVRAFKFAQQASNEGDVSCLDIAGTCYRLGHGTAKDPKKALQLFEKAATKGNPQGMYGAGCMYSSGIGCVRDNHKAVDYFERASEEGVYEATNELGNCYYAGKGVEKNFETAAEFFLLASENNVVAGRINVATMKILGHVISGQGSETT